MNVLNVLLSVALVLFIIGSAYFIKMDSQKKQMETNSSPDFISTKYAETNLRTGPSLDYPIIYTYNIRKMPLKVIDTYMEWYQIEDIFGQKGWVYKNLVSSTKNGIILKETEVKISNNKLAKVIAIIKPYNIVRILNCNSLQHLCKIEFFVEERNINYKGWIPQSALWGDTN